MSKTPSLLSSFVLNASGSSNTSPSLLPRMFVENQPLIPNCLAFNPGAKIVFMRVWPVLKSLPATGVFVFVASSVNAGMSIVKFGAPLANGIPKVNDAYAYIILGEISGSFSLRPFSNAGRLS